MSLVCGWCRDIHAKGVEGTEVYHEKRPWWVVSMTCAKCGNTAYQYNSRGSRNWAAPKKSNSQAWKLIRQGEIYWDRRRMSRVRNRESWKKGNPALGREATYGQVPGSMGYGR